jgi:hypothetical protein
MLAEGQGSRPAVQMGQGVLLGAYVAAIVHRQDFVVNRGLFVVVGDD